MMQTFSCLMYHNVCSNGSLADPHGEWAALSPSIKSYFVEETAFASQIGLVRLHANPVTLDQVRNFLTHSVSSHLLSASPDPLPSTLITFDDGWRGTLDLAVPILKRHGVEATVFITTTLLDTLGFLRASELHSLPSELQVGSHCKTHGFLNEMTDVEIREELRVSKLELEQLTGRPIDTVAIPNGAVDNRVRRIAQELGYTLVFTSEVHVNSRWSGPVHIGRSAIRWNTRPEEVRQFAEGELGFDPFRRMVLSLPKRILGPVRYRRLRAWWMGEKTTQREMNGLHPAGITFATDSARSRDMDQKLAAEATLPH
jgi:peptidoglycan/xylan/chitin deacetylase (PgdA/CDA1 family)